MQSAAVSRLQFYNLLNYLLHTNRKLKIVTTHCFVQNRRVQQQKFIISNCKALTMSKRKADEIVDEAASTAKSQPFEVKITEATPLADYIQLIRQHVQCDTIMPDDVLKENFERIAKAARETAWKLLFGKAADDSKSGDGDGDGDGDAVYQATAEQLNKVTELLEEHKCDACFYSPWEYNVWIVSVRDELLKRKMFDYWRDAIVQKELGPCWAKDSDLFDMEDPSPIDFYAHAGCVAPFAKDTETVITAAAATENNNATSTDTNTGAAASSTVVAAAAESTTSTTTTAATTRSATDDNDARVTDANFVAKISIDNPLIDYQRLMQQYVRCEDIVSDEELTENYKRIATAARSTIWKLLFASHNPTENDLHNAAEMLEEHKGDACFHGPYDYNDWIVLVRDELLKRKMHGFWRDVVVKQELGPCWAKDSDYFDDLEDPEPARFYAHAGCVAPFAEPTSDDDDDNDIDDGDGADDDDDDLNDEENEVDDDEDDDDDDDDNDNDNDNDNDTATARNVVKAAADTQSSK